MLQLQFTNNDINFGADYHLSVQLHILNIWVRHTSSCPARHQLHVVRPFSAKTNKFTSASEQQMKSWRWMQRDKLCDGDMFSFFFLIRTNGKMKLSSIVSLLGAAPIGIGLLVSPFTQLWKCVASASQGPSKLDKTPQAVGAMKHLRRRLTNSAQASADSRTEGRLTLSRTQEPERMVILPRVCLRIERFCHPSIGYKSLTVKIKRWTNCATLCLRLCTGAGGLANRPTLRGAISRSSTTPLALVPQ